MPMLFFGSLMNFHACCWLSVNGHLLVRTNFIYEIAKGRWVIFSGPFLIGVKSKSKLSDNARFIKPHTLRKEFHCIDFIAFILRQLFLKFRISFGISRIEKHGRLPSDIQLVLVCLKVIECVAIETI